MKDARKPIIPLGVEQSESHALLLSNGEVRSAFNITLSEEDFGRIRAGYCCVRCYEAQLEPFPVACKVCKFPMRDRQAEYVAKAYQGAQHMGPTLSEEEELALLEEAEREENLKEWGQIPSIVVPRSL